MDCLITSLPGLVMTNVAIEAMAIEIVSFPFQNGGSVHRCLYGYQRVTIICFCVLPSKMRSRPSENMCVSTVNILSIGYEASGNDIQSFINLI